MLRVCRRCGETKQLDEFFRDRRKPSGYGSQCKACRAAADWRTPKSTTAKPPPRDGPATLTVLSLGAGVQSSALLLMANAGDLPPVDCAIFADTQWEPPAVYDYLEHLEQVSTVPIHRVSAGDLRAACLDDPFVPIPMFQGNAGQLRRQCTHLFKIRPIRHKILELIDGDFVHHLVDQVLGISWDEVERIKDSRVLYIRNRYPLVDAHLTRDDCYQWLIDHGHPPPPRSSCLGCPYRSDPEWQDVRNDADQWSDLIHIEDVIRRKPGLEHATFHGKRVPLADVVLGDGRGDQECGGYCGL